MGRAELALPLTGISVTLIVGGIALSLLGLHEAIVAAGIGFALFIGAAWMAARPVPRRSTGARDIYPPYPWGPDPNLIDFSERLREEAEQETESKQR
jgi:hypothetical protein